MTISTGKTGGRTAHGFSSLTSVPLPLSDAEVDGFSRRFHPGRVLADKYEVLQILGTGGVGVVVSARHIGFDDLVALKFLRPEFARLPESVTRFTREARAAFRIRSKHVARVLDLDALADGTPFIVMELLEGCDLRKLLEREQRLEASRVIDFGRQICEGMSAAHALGIIHRDIKPENVFCTTAPDGTEQLKLLDFGISRIVLAHESQPRTLATQVVLGTPAYMSPEQLRAAGDLDQRSDIWSLGCVLYELLTGLSPFERSTIMHSCSAALEEEPAPLRTLRSDIDPELDAIVMRCLRKSPRARFADAEELAGALARVGAGERKRGEIGTVDLDEEPTITMKLTHDAIHHDTLSVAQKFWPIVRRPAPRRALITVLGILGVAALAITRMSASPPPQPMRGSVAAHAQPDAPLQAPLATLSQPQAAVLTEVKTPQPLQDGGVGPLERKPSSHARRALRLKRKTPLQSPPPEPEVGY